MNSLAKILFVISITVSAISTANEEQQSGKTYPTGHGNSVFFPLADISFADKVVSFRKGNPSAKPVDSDPREALGIPNYDEAMDRRYVALGCKGVLTLGFEDNVLVNTSGPDLFVFEIGPKIEPTKLSISKDGFNWVDIGKIGGATAAVDISSFVGPEEIFSFVRLEDLGIACDGEFPGADIDAVGAIGAGIRISLESSVLFNFNKSELKPSASEALNEIVEKVKAYSQVKVVIEGHTDNIGTSTYNQKLSESRAETVKSFFVEKGGLAKETIKTIGHGESRPIASNDTEEGQSLNRRVEILILVQGK